MKKKDFLVLIIILLIYIFVISITGVGCPIKYITGIPCMGCGMTRAYLCLIKFDFKSAFHYHPLFILPPLFILFSLNTKIRNTKFFKYFFSFGIFLFVFVWVVRVMFSENFLF